MAVATSESYLSPSLGCNIVTYKINLLMRGKRCHVVHTHESIQFTCRLGFWVNHKEFCWILHFRLRTSKRVKNHCLATTCGTNHHSGVTSEHCLVQLDHLVHLLGWLHHHQKSIFLFNVTREYRKLHVSLFAILHTKHIQRLEVFLSIKHLYTHLYPVLIVNLTNTKFIM
jgi:hypothetical protein